MSINIKNYTNYIKTSNKKNREYSLHGFVPVILKDDFTSEVNIRYVLEQIEKKIPDKLCVNLDVIYIGDFKEFDDRDINAFFRDGALFISNEQSGEYDLMDDIVHEIAHSLEAPYSHIIYQDQKIQEEFFLKRKKLEDILKSKNIDTSVVDFSYIEYDEDFDMFLYKDIGYERLFHLIEDLFVSPYAVTSIREYFANGFEQFFIKDKEKLKDTCPILFNKINILYLMEEK